MHPESPQFILAQALAYRDRLQFDRVVALCDPASVAERFRSYCAFVRAPTEADLAGRFPDVANDKRAALLTALRTRSAQMQAQIPRAVPGTNSYADLLALTPEEFVRRTLEADDLRSALIRALARRGDAIPAAIYEPPEGVTYDFHAPEATSANEVRVRFSVRLANGESSDTVEYEDLRRGEGGEWRLVARHGLLESRGATATLMTEDIAERLAGESPGE